MHHLFIMKYFDVMSCVVKSAPSDNFFVSNFTKMQNLRMGNKLHNINEQFAKTSFDLRIPNFVQ